jgi:uncharacterized protein YjbI with pentapeptide repeats
MNAESIVEVVDAKRQVKAEGADLSGSSFQDVNLAGSRFKNVSMAGVEFEDANLSGWKLHNVSLTDLRIQNADLRNASIARCTPRQTESNAPIPAEICAGGGHLHTPLPGGRRCSPRSDYLTPFSGFQTPCSLRT